MTIDKETIESAQKWLTLLREKAQTSHYMELGSSSVTDLANSLESLLKSHSALTDACKDIDTIKARLAKLETAAKAQQELSKGKPAVVKPTVVKAPPQAVDEDANDAVA